SEHPFANNLLFPRKITSLVIESAVMGTAFTIIAGDAQSGKSSCLREISLKTESSDLLAVLMLRGSGPGLFQALANPFAAEFEWNLTSNDAR
ncbi:type I restriction endonuclease, partial [Escherichia coli]|nr:type I restriction endonuclease [Escherichia coli]